MRMAATPSRVRGSIGTAFVMFGVVTLAGQRGAPPPPLPPDPAAVQRGQLVFAANCTACHGPDARGGADRSADLTRSPIAIAHDNGQQLAAFLAVGRPERRMPSFSIPAADVADLSAYFRSLAPSAAGGRGAPIPVTVVGDPSAGQAYFAAAGCATCHSPTGDLSGIGTRLSVDAIQGRLVMPRGNGGYPRSFLSPPDASEAQKTVTITHPNGTTASGTLVWITDFWVTYADAAGVRRTVARAGDVPRVEVVDPLAWHIDHMKRLTDKDMHDLTAYLVTLK